MTKNRLQEGISNMTQPYRLSYDEVVQPNTPVRLMEDPEIGQAKIDLTLSDCVVRMPTTDAVFNLLCWRPLVEFKVPIGKRHLIPRTHMSSGNIANILTKIHDELLAKFPDRLLERKDAIFRVINDIYNFIAEELGEYVDSFDILDLTQIVTQSPVKELIEDIGVRPGISPDILERRIKEANNQLLEYMATPGALPNDAMLAFQNTRSLNPLQMSQMFLTFGLRTDIDDTLVMYPVHGSAISGLRDTLDYAVEALAGIKPTFYNKVGVRISQYLNRKQQIVASSLHKIYPGDCGTGLTVELAVTEQNYKNLVGMYHVVGDSLRVFRYEEDAKEYVGKLIKLRSALTCKHRDGVCHVCGGLIMHNLNPNYNIGLIASTTIIQRVTQNVLSAKHLIQTISRIYRVPAPANNFLVSGSVEADKIRWHPEVDSKVHNWQLGVSIRDFMPGAFSDPSVLKKLSEAREAMFGRVRSAVLRDINTGETVTLQLQTNGRAPFFTRVMLEHIRTHYKELQRDEHMVWIPMGGTEDIPLMTTTIINDNILEFVRQVEEFLSTKIASYRSCTDALHAFSTLIYSKAPSINLTFLAILLKAYLITDATDCRIPEVTDPDNVRFSVTTIINSRRSIGQILAYQGLKQHLRTLLTYLSPVGGSVFDPFVGIIDD